MSHDTYPHCDLHTEVVRIWTSLSPHQMKETLSQLIRWERLLLSVCVVSLCQSIYTSLNYCSSSIEICISKMMHYWILSTNYFDYVMKYVLHTLQTYIITTLNWHIVSLITWPIQNTIWIIQKINVCVWVWLWAWVRVYEYEYEYEVLTCMITLDLPCLWKNWYP